MTILKATDADDPTTPNGQVIFDLNGGTGNDLFRLDQIDNFTAHVLTMKSIKGFYGNYSLNIIVSDLGEPMNTIEKRLDICVADFNDHAPVFISPAHNVTIRVAEVG